MDGERVMFCPFCGAHISRLSRFCFSCGRCLEFLNGADKTNAKETSQPPVNAEQAEKSCPSYKRFLEYRSSKSKERQSYNYGPRGKPRAKERKDVQQLSVPLSQCWSKSELRNMFSSSVSFWILLITVCSTDGFMHFMTDRCQFNSTDLKDIEYIYSYYYNKLEFTRFSSSLGKYVGYTEYGVKQADYLNNLPGELSRRKAEKERYCVTTVGIDYQAALTKSAPPTVRLYSTTPPSGHHPSMLVCRVFDFYPKTIKVSWFRDGKEVTSDVTSTEEMEDGDWFYQIHSHLEYTPRSGEKISCVVEHASLKEPLRTYWDPSMPESERNKIAIGASGLVLGLVLSLAGFIYYKRKSRGRTLVPTTN